MRFPNIEKLGLKNHYLRKTREYINNGELFFNVEDKEELYVRSQDLERALEKATVVYGSPDTPKDQLAWSNTQLDCDTHKDLLIAVEELPKEPCKHEPELKMMGLKEIVELPFNAPMKFICRKCLKEIKATEWVEEIKE